MSQPHPSSVSAIEQGLLGMAALALVALLSLPAARGVSDTFGWLPFWLLALPLAAWAMARLLRQRSNHGLSLATVHVIRSAHARTGMTGQQALRRAA
jgi:hypothetical protein